MTPETALPLALILPLAGVLLIALSHGKPNRREAMTLVTAGATFLSVTMLVPAVLAGDRPSLHLFEVMPGLALAFRVEPLGMIFGLVASFLWIVNSIYSIGYMRGNNEANQTRFYIYVAVAIASALGDPGHEIEHDQEQQPR